MVHYLTIMYIYIYISNIVLLKKWTKEKGNIIPSWGKKTEEKPNSATVIRSVYGKGTVFPVNLKLQGKSLE